METLNNFETYYNGQFRKDIETFFASIPDRSKHTFDDKKIFTVQYQSLTKDFNYLNFLDITQKANFGTALFFTVLVDQVCYTHFGQFYDKFYSKTLYPKFVGNSPSTDRTNFAPREIFRAFNYSRDDKKMFERPNVEFWEAFNNAISVMENETKDFFKKHLSEVDGNEFWNKCVSEFPHHP